MNAPAVNTAGTGKPTVGLVGLNFQNFQAKEHDIYGRSRKTLEIYAEQCGFTIIPYAEIVSDAVQAEAAVEYLRDQQIDFLLLQASSLILGDMVLPFAEVSERIGFWVVPEPTFTGELPLNSLTGGNLGISILRQNFPGRKVKWFYGSPDGDDAFLKRLLVTVEALRADKLLRESRVAIVHETVPTFINLTYDGDALMRNLGIEVISVGLEEVFLRADTLQPTDSGKHIAASMMQKAASVQVPEREVVRSGQIASALLDIAKGQNLKAAALRCWPEFQEVMHIAPCAAIAYLNDHGLITSCEGDLPGAVSMLAASAFSGEAPTMNDPVAIDREQNLIQMWHCGPGPASWADEKGQTLDWHHTLNRRLKPGKDDNSIRDDDPTRTPAGVSSDISFRRGAVTLLHIGGSGDTVFVMEAEVVNGPAPPYPGSGGWLGSLSSGGVPCTSADFLETMTWYGFEHHYPIMRGHHEAAVREYAAWNGLKILEIRRAAAYLQ